MCLILARKEFKFEFELFSDWWNFPKVDERVVSKINDLVSIGIRNVREMERHINNYVSSELFKGEGTPDKMNRRFFPKKSVMRSHMNRIAAKNRLAKMDQDNLFQKTKAWKEQHKNDDFFFRGYGQVREQIVKDEGIEEQDDEQIKVNFLCI